MISMAYAQAAGGGQAGIASFLPLILIFVVFYFLILRPQQKKAKELKRTIQELKVGDEILLSSGIMARIKKIEETSLTVEISKDVEIKVQKFSVAQLLPKGSL